MLILWVDMYFQCFLLVGFALNMLVTPFLGNYCISMNPRAIRVVDFAALGTLQCGGPWVHSNPVVPSNRVTNLYVAVTHCSMWYSDGRLCKLATLISQLICFAICDLHMPCDVAEVWVKLCMLL